MKKTASPLTHAQPRQDAAASALRALRADELHLVTGGAAASTSGGKASSSGSGSKVSGGSGAAKAVGSQTAKR